MKRYNLREEAGSDPQTYAIGLKEVWEVCSNVISHSLSFLWPDTLLEGIRLPQNYCDKYVSVEVQVAPEKAKPGHVWHTVGYPLDQSIYGGSFLYHMSANRVALGCAALNPL